MSTVFSWHDKRKYFIFFITEIEIYLQSKNSTDYSVQIHNYFIINVNLIIPIIIFLLSQLFYFLMTILLLRNMRPFPLQLIFEHKWAFISMILNLFLVTDLFENLIKFMNHLFKMFTHTPTFAWSFKESLLKVICVPQIMNSWSSMCQSLIICFIFMTTSMEGTVILVTQQRKLDHIK